MVAKWAMKTKGTSFSGASIALIAAFQFTSLSAAVLTHRYPFETNADDVIGGANGTLQSNTIVTNGMAVIRSGGGVGLPANLFTNYDSITFETWFVDLNVITLPTDFEYLYNFNGPGGSMSYSVFQGGSWKQSGSSQTITIPLPVPGITNHLVWTQDANSQTAQLYLNGVQVGQLTNFVFTPSSIGPTTINVLGNSLSGGVGAFNYLNGSLLEFRVYQGALSSLEVAQTCAAGPDRPLADFGSLQTLRIVTPLPLGPGASVTPAVYADFADLTNVNITSQSDLTLASDNTNVIEVTPQRKLTTLAAGTADLTAVYQGISNTVSVLVSPLSDIALVNRYSFSELANDYTAYDSVSCANGRLFGTYAPSSNSAQLSGTGELILRKYPGYVALPAGILSAHSEITMEMWITYQGSDHPQNSSWPRIFDFGSRIAETGLTYMELTPWANAQMYGNDSAAAFGWLLATNNTSLEPFHLFWTNTLPLNTTSHIAVAYSPARGLGKLYLDGVAIASGSAVIPLSAIVDTNNWLGRSQFSWDPYFVGRYDEFRIYDGFLSDTDIAADYAAGPDTIGVDFVLHAIPSGTNVTISWGRSAGGWHLESSPNPAQSANWIAISNGVSLQSGRYNVTIPMTDDSQFFRLHSR